MKYRAVLFDFDLTLIDASPAILACYKHTLTKMGCTPPDDEVIRRTIGLTVEDSLEQMSGCHDKARIAEYREVYRIKADELMVPGTSLLPTRSIPSAGYGRLDASWASSPPRTMPGLF